MTRAPARQRHVAQLAGVAFGGIVAANALGYVFYALVSRSLGVEAYGTFSSLLAIVLVLSSPAVIAQMVIAKLAADVAFDAEGLAALVRAVDRLGFVVAAVAGALVAAAAVPIGAFLHISDRWLIVLSAISVFGAVALPFLRGILQGTSAFGAFSLSAVVENLGKVVFAPPLALALGLRGALGGMGLGYAAGVVYAFVAGRAHRRGRAPVLSLREAAANALPVAVAVVCINVLMFYDVMLAKRYLDPFDAGLYGAAALAGRALFAITSFVPAVLLPQTAIRAGRRERTRWLFLQSVGVLVLACAAAVLLFALRPRFVVTAIAGNAFAPAAPLLLSYVVAMSALAVANVVATYNIARGRMAFTIPLGVVVVLEVATIVVRHHNAQEFLQTIVVGHVVALAACASALGGRPVPAPIVRTPLLEPEK